MDGLATDRIFIQETAFCFQCGTDVSERDFLFVCLFFVVVFYPLLFHSLKRVFYYCNHDISSKHKKMPTSIQTMIFP